MLHLEWCSNALELFYSILYLLGIAAEFVLLGVLLLRRQYKVFPVFTAYFAFNVLSDLIVIPLSAIPNSHTADWVALFLLPPQYLLELGILAEIALRVLEPVRPSLPRGAVKVFSSLAVLALLFGVALAWHVNPHSSGIYEKLKYPLDLTVGFLRILLFVVIAGFAQMLGIGWRNKVFQIASGLSLYSALDLVASIVQSKSGHSQIADHLKVAAYLLELGFFLWAFTTKEVERREFSPQMRQFLVTLSDRARDTRATIVRTQVK